MKKQNKKRNRSIIISLITILSLTLPSLLPYFTYVVSASSTVVTTTVSPTPVPPTSSVAPTLVPGFTGSPIPEPSVTTLPPTTAPPSPTTSFIPSPTPSFIPSSTPSSTPVPTATGTIMPNQLTCLSIRAYGSSFDGGYTIKVFLTNISSFHNVSSWNIHLLKEYNITSIENATYLLRETGKNILPYSSNTTIPIGGTISFSFTGKGKMPNTLNFSDIYHSSMYRNGSSNCEVWPTCPPPYLETATPTPSQTPAPTTTPTPTVVPALSMNATGTSFDGGYSMKVFLLDNSDSDIHHYKIHVPLDYQITGIKDATYTISPDERYIIPDNPMPVGDIIRFGFTGIGDMPNSITFPNAEYSRNIHNGPLNSIVNTETELELSTLTTAWDDGYNTTVFLKNISDMQIDDWTLIVYRSYFTFSDMWSATYNESNYYFHITPDDWAKTIIPGDSTNFGFNATGSMPSKVPYILKYSINGTQYVTDGSLILNQ